MRVRAAERERRLAVERVHSERLKRAREEAAKEMRAKRARERELVAAMGVEQERGRIAPALIVATETSTNLRARSFCGRSSLGIWHL